MAISTPIAGAPLRAVTHYIWHENGALCEFEYDRDTYWDGSLETIEGKRFIVVNPQLEDLWEPDEERLECGHVQPMKVARGKKYYNRRRRCLQCALEAT